MRLPIIPPEALSSEQKPLFEGMKQGIAKSFQGFVNIRDDGALLGRGIRGCTSQVRKGRLGVDEGDGFESIAAARSRGSRDSGTGAHFKSAYELYAHVIVAENKGLSDEKLATIVAGQRRVDLTRQEAVAYDFASALVNGGVLPELTYRAAQEQFGAHGAAELSYLVGLYCMVSVTLNTFDLPVPE